jgi:hypothetical protein
MLKPQQVSPQAVPADIFSPFSCHESICQGKDKCCKKYKKGKRCKKCPDA